MNVVAKITSLSTKRRKHVAVPASLPSPFLSFWKNNIAMTLTIMSARNLFIRRLSIVSHKSGKDFNTYVCQIRTCEIVIMQ
jgi:hypothetical protein